MIIPHENAIFVKIYCCPICQKFYRQLDKHRHRCMATHQPGTCCHSGEIEISEEKLKEILVILGDEGPYSTTFTES